MIYHSAFHNKSWCLGSPSSILPSAMIYDTTMLPFFDKKGCLKHALLFHHRQQTVYYIESLASSIYRSKLFLRVLNSKDLIPYALTTHIQRKHLYSLYHFDPWWLLKKPAYMNITGAEELKQTNLAHHKANICIVGYNLDQSYVARIFDSRAQELTLYSLISSQSEETESNTTRKRMPSMQWVLDPAWASKRYPL